MSFQTPITIKKSLERIQEREYVLPAIQREFVWNREQICMLFDSLMRQYPIGSFLFWRVAEERSLDFRFYEFLTDYHERDLPHNRVLKLPGRRELTAILDGQQRLSALAIGLLGSHTQKLPRLWVTNPDAFPVCHLYCQLTHNATLDEPSMLYRFAFMSDDQASNENSSEESTVLWFKATDILHTENGPPLLSMLQEHGLEGKQLETAFKTLDRLWTMVHVDPVISFHEEEDQDIDRVLDIFIRVNSGGTKLSYSDLLLSIATAQWHELDAREALNTLVDDMNRTGQGFSFSKDLVLKSSLVMTDVNSIRFSVKNFTHENMLEIESRWKGIERSLRLAVRLLASFGYSERTLVADSVLIPIADYFHMRGLDESYLNSKATAADRALIRSWTLRSLLKAGIWGSALDSTLTELRKTLRGCGKDGFPLAQLEKALAKQGKTLRFTPEEIEDLADMKYGNRRVFTLLSVLYPGVDVRNEFHIDHVYPKSRLTRAKLHAASLDEDHVDRIRDTVDSLANLQLLEGPINESKLAATPLTWASQRFGGTGSYEMSHYLAAGDLEHLPDDPHGFLLFVETRHQKMKDRLSEMLEDSDELVALLDTTV